MFSALLSCFGYIYGRYVCNTFIVAYIIIAFNVVLGEIILPSWTYLIVPTRRQLNQGPIGYESRRLTSTAVHILPIIKYTFDNAL